MRVRIPFNGNVTYHKLVNGDMDAMGALRNALIGCRMDVTRELVLNFVNEPGWVQVAYSPTDLGPFTRSFRFAIVNKFGRDKHGRIVKKKK